MGRAYKNFWSLNTDEAIVAGMLRSETKKDVEVFMPMNAQMKGVDLVLMNIKTKKLISIQVKGSRAFEPKRKEIVEFVDGSAGWFFIHPDIIHKATADYFIFLVYVIEKSLKKGRRYIVPHAIIIPAKEISRLTRKYKNTHPNNYSFIFWINPKKKEAIDIRDNRYDVSEYLDKKGFDKLNNKLIV